MATEAEVKAQESKELLDLAERNKDYRTDFLATPLYTAGDVSQFDLPKSMRPNIPYVDKAMSGIFNTLVGKRLKLPLAALANIPEGVRYIKNLMMPAKEVDTGLGFTMKISDEGATTSGTGVKSLKVKTAQVEDILLNKIGKENLENMTQKEIREVLENSYGFKYDQPSLRVKLKKLNITPAGGRPNVNKMMTETVGEADLKKITKYIKDNKPYTPELIEKFPILKNLKYKTVSDWRAKNKLNIFKEADQTPRNFSQAFSALDDVNKTTVNNFIDKTKDVIGYGTKKRLFEIKRSSVKRKIESMIGRLIHRAELDGVDINTALKSLDDVNIKELVDVIKQNSILRNRIDQAKKELGITLKDFNLSHIEDVARNLKNTLKADNLFFLETKKNISLQPKLEKKIDKILENLSNAKTKKDKTSLLNDLANVEKEMIDNNIISNIDGIIYGDKSITAKSSFDRFSKEFADQAYEGDPLMARFKNGGIVGISHLTRPL